MGSSKPPSEKGLLLISISSMNELSLIKVKELARGHPSGGDRAGISS